MWPQSTARRAIIVAGCLAAIYTQLTTSPAMIEFARSLGATGWHIGILGAVPFSTLFTQFLAAVLANHLRYRRRAWFWISIAQRLVLLPIAVGPWLLPGLPDAVWIWTLIALTAANQAMLNFTNPLWLSWMGDYLPHAGLSRYWGVRQWWMQLSAAAALFAAALFLFKTGLDIRPGVSILVGVGTVFGICDILTFLKIDEPPVTAVPMPRLRDVLVSPLRDRDYRSFILFSCFWNVAAMTGAPFISFFLLSYVGMDVYRLLLLWAISWIGGAVFARRLGQLAEYYGNRPVLILCNAFKSLNMIALLLVPADPTIAFWIMVPVFMVDALLNAGIAIANNGFMIKNSPTENRTMFIAAGTALAGIAGGVASVATGCWMASMAHWTLEWRGTTYVNIHLAFALSLVLRLMSVTMARRVREARAQQTIDVVVQLIGVRPIRLLRYPAGRWKPRRSRTRPHRTAKAYGLVAKQRNRSASRTEIPALQGHGDS